MTVRRLHGAVRPYAWGSRSFLANLQGRPVPTERPEAELWLGAHPADPATVDTPAGPVSLGAFTAEDPERVLGPEVTARFGARLPFLMKILAADAPLSLQAHPDAERAREAFAAGHPCYVDDSHKPEMLVALTPFDALCGFRDPAVSAAVLESLSVPELTAVVAELRGPGGLRSAVRTLLTWPEPERAAVVDAAVAAAARQPDDHRYAASFALVTSLAAHYPGDPGVLVAVLLNQVRLAPGEAIWMPAGNLHAYLSGAGVEIMAASDNVLRGGLTPKRVDIGELLRVLRFEVLEQPVWAPSQVAPGVVTWSAPVREFALHQITVDGGAATVPGDGPRIVVCVEGQVALADGPGAGRADAPGGRRGFGVPKGGAAFVTADHGRLIVEGHGMAYVASAGA